MRVRSLLRILCGVRTKTTTTVVVRTLLWCGYSLICVLGSLKYCDMSHWIDDVLTTFFLSEIHNFSEQNNHRNPTFLTIFFVGA